MAAILNRIFPVFLGAVFLLSAFLPERVMADTPLKPLDIDTVHLYVTPTSVLKEDRAFATRHFQRIEADGEVKRVKRVDIFKNRPVFEYVDGYARLNHGEKIKISWRYRGLLSWHWKRKFPFKSIKIKFPDHEGLAFKDLNLNHIETDVLLQDMIIHEIFRLYGLYTPRMKLVKFYVNDEYSGFKVLVEEMDDFFLKDRGLPAGNIYREKTAAILGDKLKSGPYYYQYWWNKKSLGKQDNWDDWAHFNHLLALNRPPVRDVFFDKEYYAKWLAIGLWLPFGHQLNHNLFFYHNLKNQKWYPLPWDLSVDPLIKPPQNILLFAPTEPYFLATP